MDGAERAAPPTDAAPAPAAQAATAAGPGRPLAVCTPSLGPASPIERRSDGNLVAPRKFPKDSRYALLVMDRQKSLDSVDLYNQVKLPQGVSEEEWLAVATNEVFNDLNLLAGAIADICTDQSCPVMCAGQYTFAWADGVKVMAPTKVSAPRYIENVLLWVEGQLADTMFLPVEPGQSFPPNFRKGICNIFKRLFRIYAHVFHTHFKQLVELQADAALNHSFKTFVYYVKEFRLVEDQELAPLKDLVRLTWQQRETGVASETGELKSEGSPRKERGHVDRGGAATTER